MSEIDWTKPIQTKDGRKAEFIHKLKTDFDYTRLVILTDDEGRESHETYTENGELVKDRESELDIINVPEPKRTEVLDGVYLVVPFTDAKIAAREGGRCFGSSFVTPLRRLNCSR